MSGGGKLEIHRDVLERLWAQGETLDRIAAVFGVTKPAVVSAARRWGLPERSPRKSGREAEREATFLRLWIEGATQRQIALELGVHETTVRQMVVRLKPPPRGKGLLPPFDVAHARALRAEGQTYGQIGLIYGRSGAWVSQKMAGADRANPETPEQKDALEARTIAPHPRWPAATDLLILHTKGRYADLSTVARTVGRPIGTIMQRWHQIRGTV